ncbi:DEAD/DEAH box helicase [Marinicellulosiphila megalodicopiae]|uniref:DEAD/DEAH box helicase n=1 Tax=Marinicellulosiphila megalodicopiae TaxID=2724896 RepID=UPI003BB15809
MSTSFQDLGLAEPILQAISEIGYETASPIQEQSIPVLLEGRDIIGQAQTGTGKTAAFALPLVTNIDPKAKGVQILVLAPTRELAIQVSEAFQTYCRHIKGFHVAPIYGGTGYDTQLRQLKRGVQVVVGTPGRVMDHIRKGTLKLDNLQALVLDEADEMLRMGFVDDVEWVLEHTPKTRQIALFSATMPKEIRTIAQKHLNDPVEIKVKTKTETSENIRQRYWIVSGMHKLDALTRILEAETFDGIIIFVRTKTATVELAEKLNARGFAAAALNGDISQQIRERTVERLKNGKLDIVIATDVAARGIDVPRVSHVINYDIPYDQESYVHRIGRTGRAGRAGDAILFVAPRERRLLKNIERMTKQLIEPMNMPTASDINTQRINRFKSRISETLEQANLDMFFDIISQYKEENEVDETKLCAALASMAQGNTPLLLDENERINNRSFDDNDRDDRGSRSERGERPRRERKERTKGLKGHPDMETTTYKLEVGQNHGVKPGNIVGAIANEADIDSQYIGCIEIYPQFSTVDLPKGMPKEVMDVLKNTMISGQKIKISEFSGERPEKAPRGNDHGEGGPRKPRSNTHHKRQRRSKPAPRD